MITERDELYGRDGVRFIADEGLLGAMNAALTLAAPLLVTGEPGCGKTDFAFAVARWAAADQMGIDPKRWTPSEPDHGVLDCYIRSDTTARALLYHYDSLRHFADAQQHDGKFKPAAHYIELMPLGRALCAPRRRVVLIDEIDKAPRDLPNDLLRELDQRRFRIPEISQEGDTVEVSSHGVTLAHDMGDPARHPAPIVIITSNEERQLPDPFLRRCVFFNIPFPEEARLSEILNVWFEGEISARDRGEACRSFVALRKVQGLTKKPGTSELIAWVRALNRLGLLDKLRKIPDEIGTQGELIPLASCLLKLRSDLERVGLV